MAYMLIDGNSIGYAAQMSPALSCDGMPVQAVYHFLNIVRRVTSAYPGYKPLVIWDGTPKARLMAYPDYKGKREDTTDKVDMRSEYHAQVPVIRALLKDWGIDQIMPTDCEADDVAHALTRVLVGGAKNVLLITGDKDWLYYVISPLVAWHDPRDKTGKTCTFKGFSEFTGYRDRFQFLQAKALLGDVSDNIKGINGIGPKCCAAIFQRFAGVPEMVDVWPNVVDDLTPELRRFRKVLTEFCTSPEAQLHWRLNMQLMSPEVVTSDALRVTKGVKDMEAFSDACHELKFVSIAKNIEHWDIF